jgi:hypothetical protein
MHGLSTTFVQNPLLFGFFQVIGRMFFERWKEFEKYLARNHPEDRNLDHILRILHRLRSVLHPYDKSEILRKSGCHTSEEGLNFLSSSHKTHFTATP